MPITENIRHEKIITLTIEGVQRRSIQGWIITGRTSKEDIVPCPYCKENTGHFASYGLHGDVFWCRNEKCLMPFRLDTVVTEVVKEPLRKRYKRNNGTYRKSQSYLLS